MSDGAHTAPSLLLMLINMFLKFGSPPDVGEVLYGDHPLGRLISGTEETISPMTRRQIQAFYRRRYVPPAIVIAVLSRPS